MTSKTYKLSDYNITSGGGTLKKGVGRPSVPKRKSGGEQQRDKVDFERWKNERKKQSDKPAKPLGGIKKIGPKPGTQQYVQENYLLKPGYKNQKRERMNIGGRANLLEEMGRIDARKHPDAADRAEKSRVIGELNRGYKKGGLIKGKPKLAKRGWK